MPRHAKAKGRGECFRLGPNCPKRGGRFRGRISFGYGPRLFAMRNGIDQVNSVTRLLRYKPSSKRAVIQLFNAEDIALDYALSRWAGLSRFLDDGRVEIDSNVVERAIRPIALNRKNALFAGSDGGAGHWAVVASLVETCKLNGVDPQAYLADVITRIVAGYPQSQIDDLLPWAYASQPLKAVA